MRLQSISLRQPLSFVCWLLLFSLDPRPISIAQVEASVAPYPTGTHLQLVRQFYGSAHGLPADDIQAVSVTREGIVIAASRNGAARLEGERWVKQAGISGATALFAPREGPSALAAATNGIEALEQDQWRVEEGRPIEVIAFASEPDGGDLSG